MNKRIIDYLQIILIYLIIGFAGYTVWSFWPHDNQVLRLLASDIVMTIVCFLCSVIKKNSSVYDAYWSVIPFYFVLLWMSIYPNVLDMQRTIIIIIICLWSWRLTLNWARSWTGFHHEDWRYVKLAKDCGKLYPIVNFFGIHLFPTLLVFAGMWPIYYTFQYELNSSVLWFFGIVIASVGIVFEFIADNQLAAFRKTKPTNSKLLDTGLWSRSRNPNYLGELLFWIGLFVIGIAYKAPIYSVAGSLSMIALFIFISIPLKEERMSERKANFEIYKQQVPKLIPRIF